MSLIFVGIISAHFTAKILKDKDPEIVVIDEIIGMWISVFGKYSFLEFVLAFIIFRILDITKPYPIKKFEKLSGGFGIVADDIVSGIFTNVLIIILSTLAKYLTIL